MGDSTSIMKILIIRFKVHSVIFQLSEDRAGQIFLSQLDPSVSLYSTSVSLTSYHTLNSNTIFVGHVLQKAGADPGGRGLGGQDTPFWGTPKLHKEGKNVACMHANATCFSS